MATATATRPVRDPPDVLEANIAVKEIAVGAENRRDASGIGSVCYRAAAHVESTKVGSDLGIVLARESSWIARM